MADSLKVLQFPNAAQRAAGATSQSSAQPMRAVSYPLQDGDAGVARTVRYMRAFVEGNEGSRNAQVIQLATQITANVANRDAAGERNAIYNWVKQNIKFRNEADERLQSPLVTLRLRAGDCDDHASLIAALLRVLGHRVAFRTLAIGGPDFSHVECIAFDKRSGQWVPLDTTVAQAVPGWQAPNPQRVRDWQAMGDATDIVNSIVQGSAPLIQAVGSRIAHGQTPGVGFDVTGNFNSNGVGIGTTGISTGALAMVGLGVAVFAFAVGRGGGRR
ncbi:MAG: transglutaminase protein [Acidobacteriales bacterium]|nr:transglutaminase protein [Terriglobales bacterium]